jgi:phosphohistidine phosphatase
MRLYFMRHALAEEPIDGITDAERKLTDKGIANTQQAARVMKGLGITPNCFYTSPLVRTQQTADIVGKALGITPEARKEVGPGFSIHAVETLTQGLGEDDEVLFVGHEPDLSTTISSLTGARIVMKRGGLARIDIISPQPLLGELVWLLAPRIFDELH